MPDKFFSTVRESRIPKRDTGVAACRSHPLRSRKSPARTPRRTFRRSRAAVPVPRHSPNGTPQRLRPKTSNSLRLFPSRCKGVSPAPVRRSGPVSPHPPPADNGRNKQKGPDFLVRLPSAEHKIIPFAADTRNSPFSVPSRSLPHLFPASANRLQPVPHTSPPKERTFAAGCCVPHGPQTPPAATGRSPRFTPAKACLAPPEQLVAIQCNSGKPPIIPAAPKFATGRAPQPKRNVRRLCAAANGRPRLRIVRTRRHTRRQREPPSETASKRRHEHSDI